MSGKIISFRDQKSKRVKDKALVTGEQDVGKLYAEDFAVEFNNILKKQRGKNKDECTKCNS